MQKAKKKKKKKFRNKMKDKIPYSIKVIINRFFSYILLEKFFLCVT